MSFPPPPTSLSFLPLPDVVCRTPCRANKLSITENLIKKMKKPYIIFARPTISKTYC